MATASYKELQKQVLALQKQAEEARIAELSDAMTSIQKTLTDYEISVDDLIAHLKASGFKGVAVKAKKAKKKVEAKYKDKNSEATWSGRGIAPAWIKAAEDAAEAAGKPRDKAREKFLIKA